MVEAKFALEQLEKITSRKSIPQLVRWRAIATAGHHVRMRTGTPRVRGIAAFRTFPPHAGPLLLLQVVFHVRKNKRAAAVQMSFLVLHCALPA